MFPTADIHGTTDLPQEATFWMPKRADIDDDGIGCYFRDAWTILDVTLQDAQSLVCAERNLANAVDGLARNGADFERFANLVEGGLDGEHPPDLMDEERAAVEVLGPGNEPAALEGLELGVAGLVYALASVRMIPAASCRGHTGPNAWSDVPVVLFAATKRRAIALRPLVGEANCLFDIDPARPDLLVVRGRSIRDTMDLAQAVIDASATFVQSRPRRRESPWSRASQQPLF